VGGIAFFALEEIATVLFSR